MTQNARLPYWIIGDKPYPDDLNDLSRAVEDASRFSGPNSHSSPSYFGSAQPETEFALVKIVSNDAGENPEGITKNAFYEVIWDNLTGDFIPKDGGINSYGINEAFSAGTEFAYTQPLIHPSGEALQVDSFVFIRKLVEGLYVTTAPSKGASSKRLIWFTGYLHIENIQVFPGQVILNNQYIGDIAAQVNNDDFGGDSHLHWGIGDGIRYIYPRGQTYISNVGQTFEIIDWFNTEYDFIIASDHSPLVDPPYEVQLTSGQIQEIKNRTRPPVADDTILMWQNSTAHSNFEYYSIDFARSLVFVPPGSDINPPDSGIPVFNSISEDVTDVVSTVMSIQNVDIDIDPAGHNLGWQVIIRHELITDKEPDEIPLIGLWSKPTTGFPTYKGYVSHLQFNENFPIERVGSFAHIGVPTSISSGSECWTAYDFDLNVDTNNANFSALNWWRISRSAVPENIDITGIAARSDGCPLLITHVGSYSFPLHPFRITLKIDSVSSSGANRIIGPEPYTQDFVLWENQSVLLRYDLAALRWRIVAVGEGIFTGADLTTKGTSGLVLDPDQGEDILYLRGNSSWDDPNCWEAFGGALDTSQNDYNASRLKWWRLTRGSSPSNVDITGIVARDDGCPILLTHDGLTGGGTATGTITLKMDNSSSIAANRIRNADGTTTDLVLYSFESCLLRYDVDLSIWRVIYPRIFKGSSGGSSLGPGWVPKAESSDSAKFLRGDATWAVPAGSSYTFATDRIGSDFSVSVVGTAVTHHLPNADVSVSNIRGVVDNVAQSWDGQKTFLQTILVATSPLITSGGVIIGANAQGGIKSDFNNSPSTTRTDVFANPRPGFSGPQALLSLVGGSPKFTFESVNGANFPQISVKRAAEDRLGLTGIIGTGAQATSGLVTNLGSPPTGPLITTKIVSPIVQTPAVVSGTTGFITAAEFSFNAFPTSATQIEFILQPPGYYFDNFFIEITEPFTKSLPGGITVDLGTVATPGAYITAGNLVQSRGTIIPTSVVSMGTGLNSLTQSTSLKARVNYTTGSLTAGSFKIKLRFTYTGDIGYAGSEHLMSITPYDNHIPESVYNGYGYTSYGGFSYSY